MQRIHDCVRWRLNHPRIVLISLAALVIQAVLLLLSTREENPVLWILAATAFIALVQLAYARSGCRAWRMIDMTVSLTLFGGLGMALGGFIDSFGAAALCCACHGHSLFNWSNGLMLVLCFVGCRLFILPAAPQRIPRFCGDCLCMLSMMAGMFFGDFLLMPLPGGSGVDFATAHGIMLLGMFFGNLSGLVVSSVLGSVHITSVVVDNSH